METKTKLEKIKSQYIIENIFVYVKDNYKYKLIKNSKRTQKLLKINIEDYKIRYFKSINFNNFLNFLTFKDDSDDSKFNENFLKDTLKKQLEKYKIDEKIFINEFSEIYFTNKFYDNQSQEIKRANILNSQLFIDIYSPLFESLSKKDIFEKLFFIRVPLQIIRNKNLIGDFIKVFNELNIYNPNFASFCFEIRNISYFLFMTKNLKQFNKLILKELSYDLFDEEFYLKLFSLNNIENNLSYLEIKLYSNKTASYQCIRKKINNLKGLKTLILIGFYFTKILFLQLNNLENLYLHDCDKIAITEKCSSLKNINLLFTIIKNEFQNLKKTKLPELEIFKSYRCDQEYRNTFDFKTFKKLKYLFCIGVDDFLEFGNIYLQKIHLKRAGSKEAEIKMIKKLFEIKTLKEIKLEINYINNDDIELIEGNNPTVEILTINFGSSNYTNKEIILYNFQKKFPNLKEIRIYIVHCHYNSYLDTNKIIDINENNNCKINKFKFSEECNFCSTTKFFIHSFESLVSIEFGCMHNLYKLDESFPIFNENCKYNFKSLTKFIFINNKNWPKVIVDLKIIKNIINNLNKMPNIKSFIFK